MNKFLTVLGWTLLSPLLIAGFVLLVIGFFTPLYLAITQGDVGAIIIVTLLYSGMLGALILLSLKE